MSRFYQMNGHLGHFYSSSNISAVTNSNLRSGVNARMDSKFPHHPLMPSEASYKKNVEAAELNMLRKTMGAAMPLKLSMERKAASKVTLDWIITSEVMNDAY